MTETKTAKPAKPASAAAKPRPSLTLREGSTFKDLADRLKVRPRDLLDKLEARGYHLGTNELLEDALAAQLAKDLGIGIEIVPVEREMRLLAESKKADLVTRPPVVTIMGQDDPPRRHPLLQPRGQGVRRHHPAHRRLPRRP